MSHCPADELSSWKEISLYLGISLRTAQVWEIERGLPVRRLPGGRGRVSARIAELENWKGLAPRVAVPQTSPAPACLHGAVCADGQFQSGRFLPPLRVLRPARPQPHFSTGRDLRKPGCLPVDYLHPWC